MMCDMLFVKRVLLLASALTVFGLSPTASAVDQVERERRRISIQDGRFAVDGG